MKISRREKPLYALTIALMAVYFVLGCGIFDDYGCGPDEGIERQTSLVNFRYTIERLRLPVPDRWTTFLAYLPDLKEYRDRYYGTALHQPLVLIEAMGNFTMPARDFYRMRHFYTFLNWYAATIFFYALIRRRFGDPLTALIGWLILVLTPRFFAEAFYNNKDILFTAWTIFSLCTVDRWIQRKTVRSALLTAAVLALTVNTRLNGLAYLPIAIAIYFISALRTKEKPRVALTQLLLIGFLFLIFLIAITPNLWESPLPTLIETFRFSAAHPNHSAQGNLFFGKLIDASLSRRYVAVWIALTTPTGYLILSAAGLILFFFETFRRRKTSEPRPSQRSDLLALTIGAVPLLYIVLRHVTIYNTWRHCYFVYPTIVYFAAFAVNRSISKLRAVPSPNVRAGMAGLAAACLIAMIGESGVWIARNHPYQFAYFAPPARPNAEAFSGDYWGIATRQLLEAIAENDPSSWIQVNHLYTQTGSINRGNLTDADRARMDLSYEINDDTDYILFSRDEKTLDPTDFPGFEPWYEIRVDGSLIGAVLKRTGAP